MRTLDSYPRMDGYRMPGEFEPHVGSWMLWPERTDIWPFGAKPAQKRYAIMAEIISQFEPVTVGVSGRQYQNARFRLPPSIRVVEISYNGCWIRDSGPTFVVNNSGGIRGIDWRFNAWGGIQGGLYFPWDQDDLISQKILDIEQIERYRADIVLEGGAIHVDGQGTLLAVEESIINSNRNPGMNKEDIEKILSDYLSVEKFIWLKRGLFLDETGGHIDNMCSFIRPGTVALTWTDDKHDPQYDISCEALEVLSNTVDARGRGLQIHKIHQPDPIYITKEESDNVDMVEGTVPRNEGARLPATYINFYVANKGVIVPLFDDPHDQPALAIMQALYPEKRVVGIPTRDILFGGGNVHCAIQQIPLSSRLS